MEQQSQRQTNASPKYDEKRFLKKKRESEIKITACEMEIKASGMLREREKRGREEGGEGWVE